MFSFFIHTHTDCTDALKMCIGQLKKYFPEHKRYIITNEMTDLIKDETVIIYNESDVYTKRIEKALSEIDDEFVLYMHEDMILYDEPDYDELNRCVNWMKEKFSTDYIKLIGNTGIANWEVDTSIRVQHGMYTFSVQPTIWRRESFIRLMKDEDYNIWELEENIQGKIKKDFSGYTYFKGNEPLRGQAHYDSLVFPFIATAIVKGMWNNLEYSSELKELWKEYDIDSSKRKMMQNGPVGSSI